MQGWKAILVLLVSSTHGVEISTDEKVTPVQKVIELLDGLNKEVAKETEKTESNYEKAACFCKEEKSRIEWMQSMSSSKSDQLASVIEEDEANSAGIFGEVNSLTKQIADLEQAIVDETAKRKEEHEKYMVNMTDIEEAVNDIKTAIETIEEHKSNHGDGVQLHLDQVQQRAQRFFDAMSSGGAVSLSQLAEAKPPHGYKFHSNEILNTMDSAKDEYLDVKNQTYYAEFERQKASDQKVLNYKIEIRAAEARKQDLQTQYSELQDKIASAKAQQQQELTDQDRYKESLESLTQDCQDRARRYDEDKAYLQAEQDAITKSENMLKASGISAENAVAAGAFVQEKRKQKATSFLQVQQDLDNAQAAKQQLAAEQSAFKLLADSAKRLRSQTLSMTLMKARVSQDHFVKVRGLIKDMVARLQDDARSEASQKIFCDHQLKKATRNRDKADETIEDSKGAITRKTAERELKKEDNAEKSQQMADIQKAKEEMAALHKEEGDNLMATKIAAGIGKDSIVFAIQTLKQVFGSSFIQAKAQSHASTTFTIIKNLESIQARFQSTMDETDAKIEDANNHFDQAVSDLDSDYQGLKNAYEANEARIHTLDSELFSDNEDFNDASDLKEETLAALEKLKVACVDSAETYEERSAKAKQELDALKEAYQILDNWDEAA